LFRTDIMPIVASCSLYVPKSFNVTDAFNCCKQTLEGHSVERIYLRQRSSDGSVNKTILKPRLALAARYVGFSRGVKFRVERLSKAAKFRSLYDIGESNPVPASGLWSGSDSKVNQFVHVPTSVDTQHFKSISNSTFQHFKSKSMHAFLNNLANRQTDKQTRAKTFTSSFVGGKWKVAHPVCSGRMLEGLGLGYSLQGWGLSLKILALTTSLFILFWANKSSSRITGGVFTTGRKHKRDTVSFVRLLHCVVAVATDERTNKWTDRHMDSSIA